MTNMLPLYRHAQVCNHHYQLLLRLTKITIIYKHYADVCKTDIYIWNNTNTNSHNECSRSSKHNLDNSLFIETIPQSHKISILTWANRSPRPGPDVTLPGLSLDVPGEPLSHSSGTANYPEIQKTSHSSNMI